MSRMILPFVAIVSVQLMSSPARSDELAAAQALQSCNGKSAGDACSVNVPNKSFRGVCTAVPFGRGLACLAPVACAKCGDGIVNPEAGEQCDPGEGFTPACNINCTASVCGDGIVNPAAGEQCDPGAVGAFTSFCNSNCTVSRCGDGIVNAAAGEQCDTGGESASCNADCTVAVCGDLLVNRAAGEECDEPPNSSFCTPQCKFRR